MPPWGKAGQRLTEKDAAERARKRRQKRGYVQAIEAQAAERAHRDWELGRVRPFRITMALDLRKLYGPEVDEACGVAEPTVDRWEAGEVYPTWEQLNALARLTGMPIPFFTRAGEPIGADEPVFLCGPRGRLTVCSNKDAVLEFSHEALVMAGIRAASPAPGHADDGRLF